MSKLNLLIHVNGYEDSQNSNEPTLNNFKWHREYLGVNIDEPDSKVVKLPSGDSIDLFSGSVTISADATTKYDLSLKSGTSSTYRLSHSGGTAPVFRVARSSGGDATTEVTVTKNGKVLKFESTGGTSFDLISNGVVVGDRVRVGDEFNPANQGEFKIIGITSTSFSIENESGVVESNILLDVGYDEQVNIYSAAGVQVDDKIEISNNFSLVTKGTYEITDVSHDYLEFHSVESLPEESDVSNDPSSFTIYRSSKKLVYLESNSLLNIKINGSSVTNTIEPFEIDGSVKPGIFLTRSTVTSLTIENPGTDVCNVYYITAE